MRYLSDARKVVFTSAVGVLCIVLIGVLIAQPAAAGSLGPVGSKQCVRRQSHLVAAGKNPSGEHWTVAASIQNNGGCRAWLLRIEFRPSGTPRGSSRWGWRIPAGGQLSAKFMIQAQDEGTDSGRVRYGAVGVGVRKVVLTMSNGDQVLIHPKLFPLSMRERFSWLRGVRYFLRYYPAGEHVRVARLFDATGGLVRDERGSEGEF